MKRRIASVLMALVMLLSLLPVQALAEDAAVEEPVTEIEQVEEPGEVEKQEEPADPEQEVEKVEQEVEKEKQELVQELVQSEGQLKASAAPMATAAETTELGDFYTVLGGGTLTMQNDVDYGGSMWVSGDLTIDLNGYVLNMTGGNIVVESGGSLTITDSRSDAEHKFTPDANGLWVRDEANGTKTVKGGVIYGGTGSSSGTFVYGGGVYVAGTFNMEGGNIVGCTASATFNARGGGVFVADRGKFTMSGGSIAGCTTVGGYSYGGGIYNEGTVKLSGTAEIRDCHAKHSSGEIAYGGGISDNGEASEISGNVRITGCTASGGKTDAVSMYFRSVISGGTFDGSVWNPGTIEGGTFNGRVVNKGTISNGTFNGEVVNEGGTISGGTFNGVVTNYGTIAEGVVSGITVTYKANGEIYVTQIVPSGSTAIKPVDPTNSAGKEFLGWFKADGTEYDFTRTVTEDITLTAKFAVVTRKVETEQELVDALADSTVDIIKLGSDVAINATLNITRAVTLDIYGYMLEMKGNGSVITIKDGGHLTLVDSDLTPTYYFTPDANGLWKWGTSGTKTVNGGVIYGGTGTEKYDSVYGGGVLIEDGGQFTMNGGSIVGCQAIGQYSGAGGGVKVEGSDKSGVFEMNGGAIIGCAANSGGGVETDYNSSTIYGKFIMNGGVIDSCVATERVGGGVYASAPFVMEGGEIKNCVATNGEGGGVFLGSSRSPHTLNGTIDAGTATNQKYVHLNNSDAVIGANANIHANITLEGGMIALADGVSSATIYGKITGGYDDGLVAVTYQVNGADYATQIVRSGSTAIKPVDPAATGSYKFDGWFKADGTRWDYTTAVTENTTLMGWLYVSVTNETELGAALADDTVDVIRLTKDIAVDAILNVRHGRDVILDLNGYVLDLGGNKIYVNDKSLATRLTLIDSNADAEHKFVPNTDGLWVRDEQNGTKIVKGGVITGGHSDASDNAGGIDIGRNGTVIMNAGHIVGCYADSNGGGVHMASGGIFTMNGGGITGCVAKSMGGGVCVSSGTFTMTGGSITDCKARDGGALYLCGTMIAGGGTVDGTVELDADGVITGGGSTFSGLIINNNTQAKFSGAYSPMGIVGEEPKGQNYTYYKVTFDLAGGDMEYAERYFLEDVHISDKIEPARVGYLFEGWYNGENEWDHANDKVTGNMTLTAKWTACNHSGHTGAQPTCTTSVICTVCKGTIAALGHDWGAWTSNSDNTHTHSCQRSGCGSTETLSCVDGDNNHICDDCGKIISNHEDVDKNHVCDICKKIISNHVDADKNHVCDYCGKTISNHEDADKNHVCDDCGKTISNHEDADKNHVCDYCGRTISNHVDADKNHICDYCGKTISNHEDVDRNHVCDYCGKTISNHTGGMAYCNAAKVCGYCGKSYGDKDPANHANLVNVPAKAATTSAEGNIEHWYCDGCGKYYKDAAAQDEIAQEDTVIAKRRAYTGPTIYPVRNGTNPSSGTEYPGGSYGLIYRATVSEITGVQVDGKAIGRGSYTTEGRYPVELYLKAAYLSKLARGSHTLTVLTDSGSLTTAFTVGDAKTSPTTFDAGITVYAAAAVTSLTGLELLRRRRKEEE